jgi:UDP-N-acetyl-D-mannosaminuronic acid transferase (WecB/TagA/CpsF family)
MQTEIILGVRFFTGPFEEAVERAMAGAFVNAPSGPGLAGDLVRSPVYRAALLGADMNLTDSGAMVLLWRAFTRRTVPRYSGLRFIRALLEAPALKQPGATFWIMPSEDEQARNLAWLGDRGFAVGPDDCFLAPRYGPGEITEPALIERLRARRPRVVILAIGGGVQERLGWYLRRELADTPGRPGILCLGAAIAFLTGGQAPIPVWADRARLGWLIRLVSSPRRYYPRYREALGLVPLLWRYRDRLPPMQAIGD